MAHTVRARAVVLGVVGWLLLVAWGSAEAQMRAASAELVRVTGRVDVLAKGQSTWTAATVGARLVEGDQVRALVGGAADLSLPDGSTILVAENSRFAVTKLDYDAGTRDRDASFHVVVGKVRAQVSQAAVSLVRSRQSNFNISTPNGVAAVRGTIVIVAYNPATREVLTFVFPSPGQLPSAARVTYVTRQGQSVTITGNNFVSQVGNQPPGPPTPVTNLPTVVLTALQTAQNPSTLGSNDLIVIQVFIPTALDTQFLADSGGGTGGTVGGATPTGGGSGGACPGCGQDTNYNKEQTPPLRCPSGQVGTPPNCRFEEQLQSCPSGQVGTPPNCRSCGSPPC